jgi:hypothetical protein
MPRNYRRRQVAEGPALILVQRASALDLPDDLLASCDALICDPPYSPRVHDRAYSCNPQGRDSAAEHRDLGFAYLSRALRVALARATGLVRRWSVVFSDVEGSTAWRIACEVRGAEHIRAVPWVRWSQAQLTGDRPPSGCELVNVFHRRGPDGPRGGVGRPLPKAWNGPGNLVSLDVPDLLDAACLRGREKYSCEKPLDLVLALVSYFSEPGETVLDPTCGAGTTGQACRILGRDALLCDTSAAAVARTQARLEAPLDARDRERLARWVESHVALASMPLHDPVAGGPRRARQLRDVELAMRWM